MPFGDRTYSRVISALKVVLPLIALGILSLLFVLSRPGREGEPLRFVDVGSDASVAEQRLARPDYRSVTNTGSDLRLAAETLRPVEGQAGVYTGTGLWGTITGQDGVGYRMTGKGGRLDERAGRAWIIGDVRLVRHDGHTALSDEVEIATDLTWLRTPGEIRAFGPFGTLRADSMEMRGVPDLGSGSVTVFTGNVRVVYDPEDQAAADPK
jgi:lipopolysaccharide export system protein LptC